MMVISTYWWDLVVTSNENHWIIHLFNIIEIYDIPQKNRICFEGNYGMHWGEMNYISHRSPLDLWICCRLCGTCYRFLGVHFCIFSQIFSQILVNQGPVLSSRQDTSTEILLPKANTKRLKKDKCLETNIVKHKEYLK